MSPFSFFSFLLAYSFDVQFVTDTEHQLSRSTRDGPITAKQGFAQSRDLRKDTEQITRDAHRLVADDIFLDRSYFVPYCTPNGPCGLHGLARRVLGGEVFLHAHFYQCRRIRD